jgi:hypothetical protein
MITDHYRGVSYSVRETELGRWAWETSPPDCVRELWPLQGVLIGSREDAISAARRAIESQDPLKPN